MDETNLDPEVSQVQLTKDVMDNLQTLCIRNHGVILPCYVKVLEHTHSLVRAVQMGFGDGGSQVQNGHWPRGE